MDSDDFWPSDKSIRNSNYLYEKNNYKFSYTDICFFLIIILMIKK